MERNIFRVSSYSEIGESHIAWGKGCEDTVVTGQNPKTGVTAIVVSDGAGSCQYAKEGSTITAETALEILLGRFDKLYAMHEQDVAELLLGNICALLEAQAITRNCNIGELSATLVCAAMAPDGRFLFFHVGDGIIAACDENGICRVVSQYYHEIARNFTTFVTIPGTPYNLGRGKGGVASFLLTSDGSEYLMTFDDGWLTSQADLLLQMSVFFTPERMENEMQQLTAYYKSMGMYDDASYAMLADRRLAAGVFSGMDKDLRRMIFYLPEHMPKRVQQQYHDCFAALAAHPEGVRESQMTRILRTHTNRNTFRKLTGPLTAEAIGFENGTYYF